MEERMLWQFNYHKGQGFNTAVLRESTEARAFEKAVLWCEKNGYRSPSSVRPWLVAEEIVLPEDQAEIPVPVVKAGVMDRLVASIK